MTQRDDEGLAVSAASHASRALARDVAEIIDQSRQDTARTVNIALTALYWRIGTCIRNEVLRDERAAYGSAVIAGLGATLEVNYGRGFGEKSLRHMVRFAEVFPDEGIVSALRRELSWTHFRQLI